MERISKQKRAEIVAYASINGIEATMERFGLDRKKVLNLRSLENRNTSKKKSSTKTKTAANVSTMEAPQSAAKESSLKRENQILRDMLGEKVTMIAKLELELELLNL